MKQRGFTLIELMIVVAILGLLFSIASSSYRKYTSKAQFTACLEEISPAITLAEIAVNAHIIITTPDDIGLSTASACSLHTTSDNGEGIVTIQGTIKGQPEVNNATITWSRSAPGTWTCSSDAPLEYTSKQCPGV